MHAQVLQHSELEIPDRPGTQPLSLGVEEEFLVVDGPTGRVAPYAAGILDAAPPAMRDRLQPELTAAQVETVTIPHQDLRALGRDLLRCRRMVASLAARAGCAMVASGTAVLEASPPTPLTDRPRYRLMAREYGPLLDGQGVCGCHVHVGMADREEAVQVSNHLRPWLPVLQALSANSPFAAGRDSGYASWRAVTWSRWPAAGPPPYLESADHYDHLVGAMVTSGVILDAAMVYWYARPSERVPTLEVRVADVLPTGAEATLLAGLVRGLAATALADLRRGEAAPRVPDELLRAAHWRAARDGLDGDGLDPFSERLVPAWDLVDRLVERIWPALAQAGDLPLVRHLLEQVRARGSGAARQRAAYAERGLLSDVVEMLVRQTVQRTADEAELRAVG
jgi:carboxylate-amine ligase